MDPVIPLVVSLSDTDGCTEEVVGGKAAKLSRLASSGTRVPAGFCLTVAAYEMFVKDHRIEPAIRMELGRKSLEGMRWEELWDAALRIRSAFLSNPLTPPLQEAVGSALATLGGDCALAVRSSALGEDSKDRSFAGLHESFTDVRGAADVAKAVRLVWASLWSDAALLYRRELKLDPSASRMAVLIQRMTRADRSGVAFGEDPRGGQKDVAIIEAVPGPCSLLVDGACDPDRWEIHRPDRKVVVWRPGDREEVPREGDREPLLAPDDLNAILDAVQHIEELFEWTPDMEWTGRAAALTILQARPITTASPDADAERQRSMSLRPGDTRLRELRELVAGQLIPRLEAEGQRMSAEALDEYDDHALADAIEQRFAELEKWKKIYWEIFIPFAHGVRRLATYYNDHVQPHDAYEFVGLLQHQPLLAAQRNAAMQDLAKILARNESLRRVLTTILDGAGRQTPWESIHEKLLEAPGSESFIREFEELNLRFLDITYDKTRMLQTPEPVLRNLLELSRKDAPSESPAIAQPGIQELELRLMDAVGERHHEEAKDMLLTGRLSWKLRDDDNLLVSRLESQLLRGLELAIQRLRESDRVIGDAALSKETTPAIVSALRDPGADSVNIATVDRATSERTVTPDSSEKHRQLIGQPASPGIRSGLVRVIRGRGDLGKFQHGEVLVCDAIQPNMTHLAMLASAVIERRGGMLIHGAIIARELGIPCVNGIEGAVQRLGDGDLVTVDGYLGIVSVGAPELDLELRPAP